MLSCTLLMAQTNIIYTPYLQSGGMYFSSKNITSAGIGSGIGLCLGISKYILVQSDANIYWMNGNAGAFRFAIGYKRTGRWSPAVFTNLTTIFGARTEILLDDGARPKNPALALSVRLSPLRWENEQGFISVFELGYGFGNYNAKYLETCFLSLGLKL